MILGFSKRMIKSRKISKNFEKKITSTSAIEKFLGIIWPTLIKLEQRGSNKFIKNRTLITLLRGAG